MNILGYTLDQTCCVCPEQYDVYKDGEQVGYLRLRHGWFRADLEPSRQTVYEGYPKGDGIFDDCERDFYLTEAIKAIDYYRSQL